MEELTVMNERLTAGEAQAEAASGPVDGGEEQVSVAALLGIEQEAPAETVEQPEDEAVDAPARGAVWAAATQA